MRVGACTLCKTAELIFMNIQLRSREDILGWLSLFRILGYDLCIPIWDILEIPTGLLTDPEKILKFSRDFFGRGGEIPVSKTLSSDDEVSNHLEARRMIDLGHLYNYFGKVVASYGEQTAIQLFSFGEIHFVGEVSRHWDIWHSLFSKLLRNGSSQNKALDDELYNALLSVIQFHFKREKAKQEELKYKFDQMCRKYYSNLQEERTRLYQLLPYGARNDKSTKNESFDSVYEELEQIFSFDLLLLQIISYQIWRDFLSICTKDSCERVFQFIVQQLSLIDRTSSKEIDDLKSNYLEGVI